MEWLSLEQLYVLPPTDPQLFTQLFAKVNETSITMFSAGVEMWLAKKKLFDSECIFHFGFSTLLWNEVNHEEQTDTKNKF